MVRVCIPAGKVTAAVTVVQVCQPPVAGMLTGPVRLVPDVLARWKAPVTPLGEDTRKLTVYVLAVATLTVYRNHCPVAVQPRSSPRPAAPVSVQASRSTASGR